MRIGVITFHDTLNFGATLQCVALNKYLSSQGNDVITIDYLPSYVRDKKSVFKEIKKISNSNKSIKAFMKGILYLLFSPIVLKREKKYRVFLNKHVFLSQYYPDFESLSQNPPAVDLLICGSDQIWNPALTNGEFDDAFFLKFHQSARKAAYGISTGECDLYENKTKLTNLTASIDYISSREESTAMQLQSILNRSVYTVLDCTLLLESRDYTNMEIPCSIGKPYVLLYNIQNSEKSCEIARLLANREGLAVVDISPNLFQYDQHTIRKRNIGPGEFLTIMKNATYVVTNSFHGTVFAVIYKKNFYSVPHTMRSKRVKDFLFEVGLDERIVYDSSFINDKNIDYNKVEERLSTLREHSKEYLHAIISDERV